MAHTTIKQKLTRENKNCPKWGAAMKAKCVFHVLPGFT